MSIMRQSQIEQTVGKAYWDPLGEFRDFVNDPVEHIVGGVSGAADWVGGQLEDAWDFVTEDQPWIGVALAAAGLYYAAPTVMGWLGIGGSGEVAGVAAENAAALDSAYASGGMEAVNSTLAANGIAHTAEIDSALTAFFEGGGTLEELAPAVGSASSSGLWGTIKGMGSQALDFLKSPTGGELLKTGAGLASQLYANNVASDASNAATQAYLDQTWKMYQQQRTDFAPYRNAGQWALGTPGTQTTTGGYWQYPNGTIVQGTENQKPSEYPYSALSGNRNNPAWDIGNNILSGLGYDNTGFSDIVNSRVPASEQNGGEPTWVPETTQYTGGTGLQGMIAAGPGEFIPEQQPGYQFGWKEFIEKPYLAKQSSKGERLSSGTLKNLTKYAEDYASMSYDNFLNRYYQSLNPYMSLANLGQSSAAGSASAAGVYGQGAGTVMGSNALAQGQYGMNTAGAWGGAAQNILNQIYPQKTTA